jgi:2,4-dienoyl-CoA reductase (NADPH2)
MTGTYDAFYLPGYIEKEKREAYMAPFPEIIKRAIPNTPIITAGRIKTPQVADGILNKGIADLIGLARVLFTYPIT